MHVGLTMWLSKQCSKQTRYYHGFMQIQNARDSILDSIFCFYIIFLKDKCFGGIFCLIIRSTTYMSSLNHTQPHNNITYNSRKDNAPPPHRSQEEMFYSTEWSVREEDNFVREIKRYLLNTSRLR